MERGAMIEAWAMQRPARFGLAAGILAAGFGVALLLIRQSNFDMATAIFAVSLAALVGAGKLASP